MLCYYSLCLFKKHLLKFFTYTGKKLETNFQIEAHLRKLIYSIGEGERRDRKRKFC